MGITDGDVEASLGESSLRIGRCGNPFRELRNLLIQYEFNERVKGDHHIFTRDDIEEILNLQPKGKQAKPYQVRQVRNVFVKYGIASRSEHSDNSQAEGHADE